MVRLKGTPRHIIYTNTFRISIPYGAIKRGLKAIKNTTFYEFQFLMVRLKVFAKKLWNLIAP